MSVRRPRASSSADVARLAGVSRATVSAVINDNKFVTEATRDRVLSAITSLDYRPDAIARSLKISRTNTVGFLLPSIESPFWPPVARAAEHHLREHAYRLFLANTDEDNGLADRAMAIFLETRLDGAIAAPPAGVRSRPYELYMSSGRPIVFIERSVPGVEADRVIVDDVRGGYLAGQHLAALGHKRIGMIAMPLTISSAAGRVQGVRQALMDAGLRLTDGMISIANFSEREGFRAAQRLLNRQPRPDAIVASSLRLTTGAFAAIQAARLRVPEDVALVGYDEMAWAQLCAPPLTVVKQPARALGRAAAALLLSRLDGTRTGAPVTEVLGPTLVVRRSCGAEGYVPSLTFDQNGELDGEPEDAVDAT